MKENYVLLFKLEVLFHFSGLNLLTSVTLLKLNSLTKIQKNTEMLSSNTSQDLSKEEERQLSSILQKIHLMNKSLQKPLEDSWKRPNSHQKSLMLISIFIMKPKE
jgi:hypothetical protein